MSLYVPRMFLSCQMDKSFSKLLPQVSLEQPTRQMGPTLVTVEGPPLHAYLPWIQSAGSPPHHAMLSSAERRQ